MRRDWYREFRIICLLALGIRFDRQWVALATEARKQTCRDLEHDPVLSEQAREVIADPLSGKLKNTIVGKKGLTTLSHRI